MARFLVIPGGRTEAVGPGPSTALPEGGLVEELYRRYAPAVYGRCRWLLRDEEAAKDATQEVFARALKSLPEFRGASSPTSWLMRIATHHCLNELRARRARWREEWARLAGERREEGVLPDRRELLRALLGEVGAEEQEVAVMYYADELTQVEIAEVTGRSLPTVRKRLRTFLRTARSALSAAFPDLTFPEEDLP